MIKTRKINYDENSIKRISSYCGVSEKFAKILFKRGYDSPEKADKFLNPSLKDLSDPFLFPDMKRITERISSARDNGETVVVYGDYDADGISAVSVLYKSLKVFGIDEVYAVIPERDDGYGLSEGVLEQVLEEYCPDLIITVDCGISAEKEVEYLLDLGVDVIVTDHHEIPEVLPDCPVLNCKITGSYPFDGLCGAGVAYKLAYALIGEKANRYLDIVAIATVADSMPLIDENRIIVSEGLKLFKNGRCCKAVKAITEASKMNEITAQSVAFYVAPRINAAGRMGDARLALETFISEDEDEIRSLAAKLNEYNVLRQTECDKMYRDAKALASKEDPKSRVLVISDEKWKNGVLGIVSAKLVEEYYKPAILLSEKDGVLHGSARSIDKINIFEAISAVKDCLIEFGGHSQAAGVTLKKEDLPRFKEALNAYLAENGELTFEDGITEVEEVVTEPFPIDFASELSLLEPCGTGNRKPLFATECRCVDASPVKFGSSHVSFKTDCIDMIYFGGYDKLPVLNSNVGKQIVFEPNVSVFNGTRSLKGYVKEVCTVVAESEYIKEVLLENQFDALTRENGEYKEINSEKAAEMLSDAKREVYGTLFILSDIGNAKAYGDALKGFDVSVLRPDRSGNLNVVCVGFKGDIPEGFGKVVYLDKPLAVAKCAAEVFVNTGLDGFGGGKIEAERGVLGDIYKVINNRLKSFASVTDLIREERINYSFAQVVFAVRVFTELGLLKIVNGKYHVNLGFKSKLENSSIFNKMKNIG
ncbi:MAG TPA: single-stranded-DNA-specific exonuclease RecJ [Clostridiales bacterium]|nr:single-stranded-DNA-specific exonuclease RecJ [Clostridiales bacterium]